MVSHSPKEGTDVKHLFRSTELQHTVGSPALLTSTCHYREKEVEMSTSLYRRIYRATTIPLSLNVGDLILP